MIAHHLDRLASLQAELTGIQADASSLLPAHALDQLADSISSWTDTDLAPPPDDSSLYHTVTSLMPTEESHEAGISTPAAGLGDPDRADVSGQHPIPQLDGGKASSAAKDVSDAVAAAQHDLASPTKRMDASATAPDCSIVAIANKTTNSPQAAASSAASAPSKPPGKHLPSITCHITTAT